MPRGYVALVLHAHLPYVRDTEDDFSLAEKWYHEAVTETYIPLINICQRLNRDRVPYRITISLSPPLVTMMADPWFKNTTAATWNACGNWLPGRSGVRGMTPAFTWWPVCTRTYLKIPPVLTRLMAAI